MPIVPHAGVGAWRIWASTVAIEPDAKTGVHHHGALESVIFVLQGRARMRWGERLEHVAEAGPGDFIFVLPFVPQQEINADPTQMLECVLVRSDNEAVVVDITDVEPVEKPEAVYWVDPIHTGTRAREGEGSGDVGEVGRPFPSRCTDAVSEPTPIAPKDWRPTSG